MTNNYDNKKKNKRITNTRLEIINCLKDGVHQHTLNDIIDHLQTDGEKINVATIYNNIKSLLDDGIIDIYPNYNSKLQRYELIEKGNYHIHFHDLKSKDEIHVNIPKNIEKELEAIAEKNGYEIHNLKIEILVKKKKDN